AVVFTRLFGADAPLARRAATNLVNLPLLVRIGACVAMILAGRGLVRAGLREPRGESWVPAGRPLSSAGAVVLVGVLRGGWTAHQNVARSAALRASDWAAAEDVRWRTQVGLSVLWTASAAVALLWGFVRSVPAARYGGLALLGLVLVKVFTVDLEAVSTGY